jgi:hypothetical protein
LNVLTVGENGIVKLINDNESEISTYCNAVFLGMGLFSFKRTKIYNEAN